MASCENCHGSPPKESRKKFPGREGEKPLRIVLVGNPNVGRSVLFNQLTGEHQLIGNWPGKAADVMSGRLVFLDRLIEVVDLPGVYSLLSDSAEDRKVLDYIMENEVDAIVNIVDSTLLERNLALTIELLSLGKPVVVALNMTDRAESQGLEIDADYLKAELEVPVLKISGLKGIGVTDMLRVALSAAGKVAMPREDIGHTVPLARQLAPLCKLLEGILPRVSCAFVAERLLLGDDRTWSTVSEKAPAAIPAALELRRKFEKEMEDDISSILASDRYALAASIAKDAVKRTKKEAVPIEERLHHVLTHRVYGIICLIAIASSSFLGLFLLGDYFATMMVNWFNSIHPSFILLFDDPRLGEFFWSGVLGGLISVVSIVLPYLIPFFILLAFLEDSGYIARAAFVMDTILHRIGLHGKAFFPLLLGYSCNVPACLGCRILETERERVLAIFAVTLIPCAATSIVVFGLVGTYVGLAWVVALFVFNIVLVAVLTRIAYSILPGEPTALIMEMPPLRRPSLKISLRQTWYRAKDFIVIAIPLLIVLGIILGGLQYLNLFDPISDALSPVTVGWLGLPAFAGILLIFGIMRKELTLLLLGTLAGTTDFASVLTDDQMIVFTLIVMIYIPCIATIGALVKEIGLKRAAIITVFEIGFAILVGGIAFRLLSLV